jgi:hypothetical protein
MGTREIMKPKLIPLLLLILGSISAYGQDENIFGAYQFCSMACRTIQIKRDHTFTEHLDGDLYNDQRYSGTWSWLGKNQIHAIIPQNTTTPKVAENSDPETKGLLIRVLDESGATLPNAEIRNVESSTGRFFKTGIDGVVHINRCDEFEIRFLDYHGRYRILKKENNVFTITLTSSQVDSGALDEIWQIEKGRLYFLKNDGKVNKEFWLEKINKSEERKIFKN